MAQVAASVSKRIDLLLAHCTDVWQSLPRVEVEIADWDVADRVDFVEEWPLEEQRWRELEQLADAGVLSPEQHARFAALQQLVARNRPIISRLRQS